MIYDIFSHSVGCLFILLMVSFAVQKLFSLMLFHLLIFAFVTFAFGVKSKRPWPGLISRSILTVLSSSGFMVLGLTLKSLLHFELLLVCVWYKIVAQFHSFVCGCSVFPTPFIEETVLSPLYILASFVTD